MTMPWEMDWSGGGTDQSVGPSIPGAAVLTRDPRGAYIQDEPKPWEQNWNTNDIGGVTVAPNKGGVPRTIQAQTASIAPETPQSWGDALSQGWSNFINPNSPENVAAYRELKSRNAFPSPTLPLDLAANVGKLALGGAENAANALGYNVPQISNEQDVAGQFGRHFSQYVTNPKGLIANEPGSVVTDVLSLATPIKGGGAVEDAALTASRPIATVAKLKEGAGAGLNVARDSGVYFTSDYIKPLSDTLTSVAREMNFRPGRPGTAELGAIMKDVHSMSDRPWTVSDLQTLEQDLNDAWKVAKKAGHDQIAGIAGRMRGVVDKFSNEKVLNAATDNNGQIPGMVATGDLTPEQALGILNQSNQIYRQAKVAQKLEAIGRKAEADAPQFAQSGEANALRKYARQTIKAHYDGKPTGLNAGEIQTLEQFNKGSFSEWLLKQGRRYLKGPVGALLGHAVGGGLGAAAAVMAGEGAAKLADRLAVQKFNRFVMSVRDQGSQGLENLLGQAVYAHHVGTPAGRSAVQRWVSSIGTKGYNASTRALALSVANSVNRPDLVPTIYHGILGLEGKLKDFASSWQGTQPTEAQPTQ